MNDNFNNGWGLDLQFPLQDRTPDKPRNDGITMILDKGLGLRETADLLEMSARYIDFWKLSFGSSALYNPRILADKIKLVCQFDVQIYPGGTFTEIAFSQGKLSAYFQRAKALGFSAVEISDGTIQISPWQRSQMIKTARDLNLPVITEIGKKEAGEIFVADAMAEQVNRDLEDGAFKVILEARESGRNVTIFNDRGNIEREKLNKFLLAVSRQENLIWEAPLKKQQVEFVTMFGPNVNLGNIAPEEVIALESLRTGLRADTFKLSLIEHEADFISNRR
ncbi:MAG: phosphosulfolactate synthase [Clostridiales bacterium]|jgi:phosphosulfolactate synthase|nr:phosphosulfolactate synthase [Clostridiales bacterium]